MPDRLPKSGSGPHQVHDRRERSIGSVSANQRLLLRAGSTLRGRAREGPSTSFSTDGTAGKLQATGWSKEQYLALLATGSQAEEV